MSSVSASNCSCNSSVALAHPRMQPHSRKKVEVSDRAPSQASTVSSGSLGSVEAFREIKPFLPLRSSRPSAGCTREPCHLNGPPLNSKDQVPKVNASEVSAVPVAASTTQPAAPATPPPPPPMSLPTPNRVALCGICCVSASSTKTHFTAEEHDTAANASSSHVEYDQDHLNASGEEEEEEASVAIAVAVLDISQESVPEKALAKVAQSVIKAKEEAEYRGQQKGTARREEAKKQERACRASEQAVGTVEEHMLQDTARRGAWARGRERRDRTIL